MQHQRPPRSQQIKRDFTSDPSPTTTSFQQQHHQELNEFDQMNAHNSKASSISSSSVASSTSYYKSRFSPYHTSHSLKQFRQQNKFSNNFCGEQLSLNKIEPQLAEQHHQSMSYFNSPMNFPGASSLFPVPPYQQKSSQFNPFKNISLNLSENSPSYFYDAASRSNVSTLSSGYCSLDENNSMNNATKVAAFGMNEMHHKHLNSSASLAHIMNWIKNAPSAENLVDLTSRILFSAVKWTKTQRNFLNLPVSDQILLLNENISELYILQMAENKSAFNESAWNFIF